MSNRRKSLLRLGLRSAGAVTDQVLSSLQHFVVLFAALHYLDVTGLGQFTLAYTTALLVLSTVRSLSLEPLTIRHALDDEDRRRQAASRAAGASLGLGLILAAAGSVTWLVFRSPATEIVLATTAILPVLFVQDAGRFHMFSARRPWGAAANDGVCFVVTLVLMLLAGQHLELNVTTLLLVWGVGTASGAAIGLWWLRSWPRLRQGWGWLRQHRDLGLRLAGETLAQQAAGRLSLFLLTVIVSVSALGLLGASRTLMTPATTLIVSVIAFAVPEAVRLRDRSIRSLDQFVVLVSVVLGVAVVLFTVTLYLIPDAAGRVLAGQNWEQSKVLLVPTAAWAVGMAFNQGPRLGLRALDQPRLILRVAMLMGVVLLAGTTLGGFVAGAAGAAWGFGLVSLGGNALWTTAYLKARSARASAGQSSA